MTTMALAHHTGSFSSVAIDISDVREVVPAVSVRARALDDAELVSSLNMKPPGDVPLWLCAKLTAWLAIMVLCMLNGTGLFTFGQSAFFAFGG